MILRIPTQQDISTLISGGVCYFCFASVAWCLQIIFCADTVSEVYIAIQTYTTITCIQKHKFRMDKFISAELWTMHNFLCPKRECVYIYIHTHKQAWQISIFYTENNQVFTHQRYSHWNMLKCPDPLTKGCICFINCTNECL